MTDLQPGQPADLKIKGKGAIDIAMTRLGPLDGLPVCLLHDGGQTHHAWRSAHLPIGAGNIERTRAP